MNSDEITSLIVKLLLVGLAPLATKFGIDGSTASAVATWLATGAVLAFGVYSHWNEKKVPENSVALVLPPKALSAPPVVGETLNLAPLKGEAKVVG